MKKSAYLKYPKSATFPTIPNVRNAYDGFLPSFDPTKKLKSILESMIGRYKIFHQL